MRKTQEGETMLKKFLAAVAVMALAISSFGGTALAADEAEIKEGDVIGVTSLEELQQGTYELDAELSCYVSAMGGVEFGASLLTNTQLNVAKDGTATMVLTFGKSSVTIYGITCDTFIDAGVEGAIIGYNDGTAWQTAEYTLSEDTALNSASEAVNYVETMTVPVSKVSDTYALGLYVNSNVMGVQFGGADDAKYAASLTVDWANTKIVDLIPENAITVTNIADLKPGTYKLDAKLSCFVTAMGGVEFGASLLTGAQLNVAKDGTASMALTFGKSSVTIYGITCDTFIDAKAEGAVIGYKDSDAWTTAEYTLSTDTALNSASEAINYVEAMKVPVTNVSDTYALGLYVNSNVMGVQFGGSDDARYAATLTVKWDQTEIIELEKVEDTNNNNTNNTNDTVNNTTNTNNATNTPTEASPKTGDKAVIMPILGLVVAGMLFMVAVSMKKETYKR